MRQLKNGLLSLIFRIPPFYFLLVLLLGTVYWTSKIPQLRLNYNIESFFSDDDSSVQHYYHHKEMFENENDALLIGIHNNAGVFDETFLRKIDSLTKELKQLPHTQKVISPVNLYEVIQSAFGGFRIPLIYLDSVHRYKEFERKIYTSGNYTGSFFSKDTQSVSILLKRAPNLAKIDNDSALATINTLLKRFNFDEFHLAGRMQTQNYYVKHMLKQMKLFATLSCVLFIVALFFVFRNWTYVCLALSAVILSIIWIFGTLAYLDISLDLLLTLVPALIFIISTSTSIHFITRFRNIYNVPNNKLSAIKTAVNETSVPNFLNVFTTALGFASLVFIGVFPIQRFGIVVAVSIMLSYIIGLLFVPSILRIIPLKPITNIVATNSLNAKNHLYYFVQNHTKQIGVVALILVLVSITGARGLKVNNYFLDDLNNKSSLKQDLRFFENNFSGIRPFELTISSKHGGSMLNPNTLNQLDTLENYLKEHYGLGFMYTPLTFIKSINKAINGGGEEYYALPDSDTDWNEVLELAEKQKVWQRYIPILSNDYRFARVTGRIKDEGSNVVQNKNEALLSFIESKLYLLDVRLASSAQLMDNTNKHIAKHLTGGLLLVVLVTTLIIGLFTKSIKLAIISLVPNLLPLITAIGFMGLYGISLKISTAIIFTIVYGIAVDDTIHFLNAYRINRHIYTSKSDVLKLALNTMWKPMLFTSIVLFTGFMIFTLSAFSSIALLGALISSSIIIALLADLFLLPVLLWWLDL